MVYKSNASVAITHKPTFLASFPQNAQKSDDYGSIADADALLLIAGDPAAEDEPIRKGTAFQVSMTSNP